MADKIVDPSEPIDYRYGGETWDSLVQKLMATLPHIYQVLNALNGTGDGSYVLPEPASGAIVRTNASGDVLGTTETASRLKTPRTFRLEGGASGSVTFDGSSDAVINVANVKGNAIKILDRNIDGTGMVDGVILVYRESSGGFVFESKGSVGSGRTLILNFGGEQLGTYNGDTPVYIDIKPYVQAYIREEATLETDADGNYIPAQNRTVISPRTNAEGSLGTPAKRWGDAYIDRLHGNADSASADGDGNNIKETYATKAEMEALKTLVQSLIPTEEGGV